MSAAGSRPCFGCMHGLPPALLVQSRAVGDTDGVRDEVRSYVLEQLGQESAILVIDESGFPKRGTKSAGVGLQYCGTSGQVENCQVGVFLDDKWSLENSHLSPIMWL